MGHYFSYAYDPVGNILFKKIQDGTTAYSYDAADELVSETAVDKVTLYAYDPNGNETKAGDTRYTYDLENKLLSAKGAGKPVSYTYTGDGLMSTRSTPSEFTAYVWDTSSDLGQLALETSSKGKQKGTQAYTYGAGPIGIVSSSGSYSFHTDSLGSVVELSDSSGVSLESYRYSAFGDAYAPGNSDQAASNLSNSIRFAGQYLDLVSDLYNMRAREYDPETGRFLQVDPLEAGAGDPTVGAYVYVNDQPTVMTDPSGERGRMAAGYTSVDWNWMCGGLGFGCTDWYRTIPTYYSLQQYANPGDAQRMSATLKFQAAHYSFSAISNALSGASRIITNARKKGLSTVIATKRLHIVERALSAYGTWYVWGGGKYYGPTEGSNTETGSGAWINTADPPSLRNGFDCSGLVTYAYHGVDSSINRDLPPGGTWEEWNATDSILGSKLLPGDIVFYHSKNHVAIYIGNNHIIEAPETFTSYHNSHDYTRGYVSVAPIGTPMYQGLRRSRNLR